MGHASHFQNFLELELKAEGPSTKAQKKTARYKEMANKLEISSQREREN